MNNPLRSVPPPTAFANPLASAFSRPRLPNALAAIVVAFVAIATLFALEQPPFVAQDEKAHLGYAHAVADLELPRIDTISTVPPEAVLWRAELAAADDDRYRAVWVANHPPLAYALVAPLVWVAELTGQPDGGLLLLRFANIAFGALGIALTYGLARAVTGGSHRLALGAAAVTALSTQAAAVLSQGMTDGVGFAATTAVIWAGVHCLHHGASGRRLAVLAGATVLAAGARATTTVIALAVVAAVAAHGLFDRRVAVADRTRRAAWVMTAACGPALLAFGWFYLRNIALYGDIGASQFLLERFGRTPRGSLVEVLNRRNMWRTLYYRQMAPTPTSGAHPPAMLAVAALALAGLAVVFRTRRTGGRAHDGDRIPVARRSLALLGVAVFATAVLIAQHVSGGGYLHPRYLLPALGAVATLVVVGLDRLGPRWLPAALIAGMATWTLANIPVGVDPTSVTRPRDDALGAPAVLRVLPTGPFWRQVAGAGVVVACAWMAVSLFLELVWRPRRSGAFGASDDPAIDDPAIEVEPRLGQVV